MYSTYMALQPTPPRYACRLCGATSYRRLTQRGATGAMEYGALYRCSGCELTFENPVTWRGDPVGRSHTMLPKVDPAPLR